jgi:hypothetical protein
MRRAIMLVNMSEKEDEWFLTGQFRSGRVGVACGDGDEALEPDLGPKP